MVPPFITGLWIANVAARVIVVINRKIQSNDVVVVILVVGGESSFVVDGILTLENLSWSLSLSGSSWRVVSSFVWMDGVVAALIM